MSSNINLHTHRKSHTKELWGLLGPQNLVLYSFAKTDAAKVFRTALPENGSQSNLLNVSPNP